MSAPPDHPPFARAWLAQVRAGHAAVAEVEAIELAALDDAAALALSDALLGAAPIAEMAAARHETSGFVEQQRRFALLRARVR